jgi:uncharacterized protein (DUF924 family)
MNGEAVADYWEAAGEHRWFTKDPVFDAMLANRFGSTLTLARQGGCDHWAQTPHSALGLVILLDQVSRNINRNSPLAFAADGRALALAKWAVGRGFHHAMPAPLAMWFVMPFEHAEDLDCQHRAVGLFASLGLLEMVHWADVHRQIIVRFGRFPHRNAVLGRASTAAELGFLKAGGFAG